MRAWRFVWLASALLGHACSSGTATPTPTPTPTPSFCTAGAQRGCTCVDTSTGTETCAADGLSYGPCVCPEPPPVDVLLLEPPRHNIVLGRPTDTSVALSVLASSPGDTVYVEVATRLSRSHDELVGAVRSRTTTSTDGSPMLVELGGLSADTKYYYRLHYVPAGGADDPEPLHSFRTRRAPGRTFHFGVQGDTHPERYNDKMFHPELFARTLEEVRKRQPDFYVMLGDDFSIEKIIENFKARNYPPGHAFQRAVEGSLPYTDYQRLPMPFVLPMVVDGFGAPMGSAAYRELRERYLGAMTHSTALFHVNGNHEQAHSANLGGVFNNAAVWAAEARLKYYPLPAPDGFYSGDERQMRSVNGYPTLGAPDGLLRDYYAFTWGDALFVTIDPYWHSDAQSPDTPLFDGDPELPWAASMGDEQYAWLVRTLESSSARWKFVFAHHVNGAGRGGAAVVGREEWGARLRDFVTHRPGWAKPIHQLFVDTGVTIFFQGHDHMFARELVDGVVYQEVPNPADNSYFAYNCDAYAPATIDWQGASGYGIYDPSEAVRLPNTGFLDVTVAPEGVRVEYVRTYRAIDLSTDPNGIFDGSEANGEVAFRYSIPPQAGDDPTSKSKPCMGAAPPAGWVYNR